MKESFREILDASASASSNFVEKMFQSENLSEEINGVKFETTITILDENDTPVMVARATSSLAPEADKEDEKAQQPAEEAPAAKENVKEQNSSEKNITPPTFEQAGYNPYYPLQYMMPYAMPVTEDGVQPQGVNPVQMPYAPQAVMPATQGQNINNGAVAQSVPANNAAVNNAVVNNPTAYQNTPVVNPVHMSEAVNTAPRAEAKAEPEAPVVKNEVNVPSSAAETEIKDNTVAETAASESEAEGKTPAFTVVKEQAPSPEEHKSDDSSVDKRKKIELLLKKYVENN